MKPLLVLVAGPYRSGTGDEPDKLAANLATLEAAAWPIFRAGHIPIIGEWVALPVMRGAGSTRVGDAVSEQVLYPAAERLLQRCDAVLRLPGESTGADRDVAIARARRLPVYFNSRQIPGYRPLPSEGW